MPSDLGFILDLDLSTAPPKSCFPACGVAGVTSQEYRFASDSSLSRQAQKLQLWGRFGAFATPSGMTAICAFRPKTEWT